MIRLSHLASRALALGVCCVAPASVAAAQEQGSFELGAATRWTTFDNSLRLDETWGFAGYLGFYFLRNLALEGQVAQVDTRVQRAGGADVQHRTSNVRLVKSYPVLAGTRFHLGGGYSFASYHEILGSSHGANAIVGVRQALLPRVGLRIDGLADYYPSPANETPRVTRNWNYSVHVGLSLLYGRLAQREVPPPPDADGDGVIDIDDRCAGTPMGDRVDATGCPLPTDGDDDGVADASDRCPNTPTGATVNAEGCEPPPPPPADSDNDGVPEPGDRCPGTAAGTRVDASGCAVLFTDTARTLTLRGVTFETGKAVLTADSRAILDPVAASLVANPTVTVEVAGHTDNTGSAATNTRLSAQRAAAVRQYLIDQGVDGARLTARGYGPSQPVASNATADGRQQNRRVELRKTN